MIVKILRNRGKRNHIYGVGGKSNVWFWRKKEMYTFGENKSTDYLGT